MTGRVAAKVPRRYRTARHPLRALLLAAALGACLGCGRAERLDSIRTHVIHSRFLSKDLIISVLLPPDYSTLRRYPVLYFFGDYGGGPALVTRHVATDPECLRLADTGGVAAMLLVGVEHDRSFMIETDAERAQVTTSTGMSFTTGRYGSWFIEEVIPFVEGAYAVVAERSGRYIGGYSLGGYAALRLGLTHPELFSRVGAHSPTLFIDSLPDASVSVFLYPTEELRNERDPLRLAAGARVMSNTRYYIDTAATDVNREACQLLSERLRSRGADCQLHIESGFHGRDYWMQHMADYLRFYAGDSSVDERR